MPNALRADVPRRAAQAPIGWVALGLVLASVLVQGGNHPAIWTGLGLAVLGLFVLHLGLQLAAPAPPALPGLLPVALLYGAVLAWGLAQAALPAPPALAHPAWAHTAGISPPPLPRIGADPAGAAHGVLRLATYGMLAWIFATTARPRTCPRACPPACPHACPLAWAWIGAVALFSTALAGFALTAAATGTNPLLADRTGLGGHLSGPFINRNSYATYAAFGMLANLALYLHLGRPPAGATANRPLAAQRAPGRWVFALGALLCAAAVVLSQSRGGTLAAALGLAVLLGAAHRRPAGGALAAASLAALLIGFIVFFLGTGLGHIRLLTELDASIGGRALVYAALLDNLDTRPWLGHGLGAFADTFRAHLPLAASRTEWALAHSSYLENAWEMGVPAAMLFYLALARVGLQLWRGLAPPAQPPGRPPNRPPSLPPGAPPAPATGIPPGAPLLPALALAVFTTGAAHASVDFSLQMPATAALFAVFLGIGWAQSTPPDTGPNRAPTASARPRRPA